MPQPPRRNIDGSLSDYIACPFSKSGAPPFRLPALHATFGTLGPPLPICRRGSQDQDAVMFNMLAGLDMPWDVDIRCLLGPTTGSKGSLPGAAGLPSARSACINPAHLPMMAWVTHIESSSLCIVA